MRGLASEQHSVFCYMMQYTRKIAESVFCYNMGFSTDTTQRFSSIVGLLFAESQQITDIL